MNVSIIWPFSQGSAVISIPRQSPMDNERLGELIAKLGTDIEGQSGFWQFNFGQVRLVCVTDESHDRMRIMAPIAALEELNPEHILACMNAHFDRALDARYCINNETLWGAFIHPLGCLTDNLFHSACSQVREVVVNFGSNYSSGGLSFNSGLFT